MDSKKNFVQKKEFEVHIQSDQSNYLGRWEVIFLNIYSGINNRSNYLALKLNVCA